MKNFGRATTRSETLSLLTMATGIDSKMKDNTTDQREYSADPQCGDPGNWKEIDSSLNSACGCLNQDSSATPYSDTTTSRDNKTSVGGGGGKDLVARRRKTVAVLHVDIIGEPFWSEHAEILGVDS